MKEIKVKYFEKDGPQLDFIEGKSDWVDLSVVDIRSILMTDGTTIENIEFDENNPITYKAGDIISFGLGVAMKLPDGYEAHVLPRSSTFKKTGLLLTNSMGIIDNSFSGNNDEWGAMFIAMRDGEVHKYDRLLQFRIQESMSKDVKFKVVEVLNGPDRGGYGTTGGYGNC